MTITPEQLAELKRLAQAATPGPWVAYVHSEQVTTRLGRLVCDCFGWDNEKNTAFIAACSPDVVLGLLESIEFWSVCCRGTEDTGRQQHAALTKISAIRDSIIGLQKTNWSEHIYPLAAALDEAGYKGAGYEIARANLGTLIEQAKAADAARDKALDRVAYLEADRAKVEQIASDQREVLLRMRKERDELVAANAAMHELEIRLIASRSARKRAVAERDQQAKHAETARDVTGLALERMLNAQCVLESMANDDDPPTADELRRVIAVLKGCA